MPRKIADIRREEIVDALRTVIAREGLNVPSYDTIATEGGMSRQLVRHYYRIPEDIAADLGGTLSTELRRLVSAAYEAKPDEPKTNVLLDTLFSWNEADVGEPSERNALECALHAMGQRSGKVRDNFAEHLDLMRRMVSDAMAADGNTAKANGQVADAVVALMMARNLPGADVSGLRAAAGSLVMQSANGG